MSSQGFPSNFWKLINFELPSSSDLWTRWPRKVRDWNLLQIFRDPHPWANQMLLAANQACHICLTGIYLAQALGGCSHVVCKCFQWTTSFCILTCALIPIWDRRYRGLAWKTLVLAVGGGARIFMVLVKIPSCPHDQLMAAKLKSLPAPPSTHGCRVKVPSCLTINSWLPS